MGNPALEEFFGRPQTIERLSEALQQTSTGVNGLKGALDAEVSGLVPSSWEGQAASAFAQHWHQESAMTARLSQQLGQLSRAMQVLASELRAALSEFQAAEMTADVNRCYITPAYIVMPVSPLDLAAAAAVPVIESMVAASMAMARAARAWASVEVAAIGADGAAVTFLRDLTPFVETEPEIRGALEWLEHANTYGVSPLAKWMRYVKLGRFAPKDELKQFVSPGELSWRETVMKSMNKKNWIALRGKSASRAAWGTAEEWSGRATFALSAAVGAVEQWMNDHRNPNLSTSARVARVTTRAAAVGAFTWAGEAAGTAIFGALGTLIPVPGVGTAVGASVGAILGAWAGSKFGGWVADHTVDYAGEVADAATKAGSDLLHSLESWNPSGSEFAGALLSGRPF